MTINKAIGAKIRKVRAELGITQEEAAYRAKLDYSYYNQIEMGKRNPSLEVLSRIAKAIGVNVKDLF